MEVPAANILMVQMLTFGIGAILLWIVALKPIQKVLAERRERIVTAQREAEEARTRAQAVETDLRNRLNALEDQAKARAAEAEAAAKKLKDELLAEARSEARDVVAAAKDQAKRDRAEDDARLRAEVAGLAVDMARKVAEMALSAEDRRKLTAKVLAELPKRLGVDA